jgi:site-specific DNA recombinase
MKGYFAYIRVSTQKQGEMGSSLREQRDAISVYARRSNIEVERWFEEVETAAKQGRAQFTTMMRALRSQKARGVIFHKIDRGARNLKDWNAIQELIESGVDVRFAHESLDMQTRGGRLTADMLAVIASDYIRNLREEIRKGILGRLKQGIYPLQAPIGYLDAGGGKPKFHDPIRAPLIQQAFELYATGNYGLHALVAEMEKRGLRTLAGGKVRVSNMSNILRRKFYTGLIEMKGVTYQGIHEPIVRATVFERVQNVLDGKLSTRPQKHDFLFRKTIKCATCGHSLIGERHGLPCKGTSVREDSIEESLLAQFRRIQLSDREVQAVHKEAKRLTTDIREIAARKQSVEAMAEQNLSKRMSRLTDALLDGLIEKDLFEEKKAALLLEKAKSSDGQLVASADQAMARIQNFLELTKSLCSTYQKANTSEKREILRITTSNFSVSGKDVAFALRSPYFEIAKRDPFQFSALTPGEARTKNSECNAKKILDLIFSHCTTDTRNDTDREVA